MRATTPSGSASRRALHAAIDVMIVAGTLTQNGTGAAQGLRPDAGAALRHLDGSCANGAATTTILLGGARLRPIVPVDIYVPGCRDRRGAALRRAAAAEENPPHRNDRAIRRARDMRIENLRSRPPLAERSPTTTRVSGEATWRTKEFGEIRVRLVDYSPVTWPITGATRAHHLLRRWRTGHRSQGGRSFTLSPA